MQRRRVLAGVLAHKNQDKNTHLPNRRFMKDVAENDRSRAESPEIITVILQYMHAQSDLVWDSAFCGGSQGVSDKCRALQRPFEMDLITAFMRWGRKKWIRIKGMPSTSHRDPGSRCRFLNGIHLLNCELGHVVYSGSNHNHTDERANCACVLACFVNYRRCWTYNHSRKLKPGSGTTLVLLGSSLR